MSHAVAEGPGAETDTWVRSAFDVLTGVPGVRRVGLALSEGGGRQLLFAANDRDNERRIDWCEVDAYEDVPLNTSVRTGRLIVGSLEDLAVRYPEFVGRQGAEMQAVASVPLSVGGQVVGGFALFYGTRQLFDDPQLATLQKLGQLLGTRLRGGGHRDRSFLNPSSVDEPVPAGARVTTLIVAPDVREVAPARRFVRGTLAAWGVDECSIDTAVLCVSELVTNAVIHSPAGCEVRLVLDQRVVRASVRDGGTAVGRPVTSRDDPLPVHGRGLQIVDGLVARWGSELDSLGMTVWFELNAE